MQLTALLRLLAVACVANLAAVAEDGADAAGDGTEELSTMDAPSDTEVECPPCIDSDTWRSAHLGYACSDYRIGGASEGYCEDVGSISTAPDAPSLEGTALQHCPRACGACPPCVPVDKELSPGLVWACVISMIAFFGLPVYKYCIDGYRWTKEYLAMWRAAEKQKMDSIKQRNTVRKAGGLFKRALLPKGSRRRLGAAVAPADPGAAAAAAADEDNTATIVPPQPEQPHEVEPESEPDMSKAELKRLAKEEKRRAKEEKRRAKEEEKAAKKKGTDQPKIEPETEPESEPETEPESDLQLEPPAAGSDAALLLFSALDKDGDGVITRDEMMGGFSPATRSQPSAAPPRLSQEWAVAQDERITAHEGRAAAAEEGIASLRVQADEMDERVGSLDGRVSSLEEPEPELEPQQGAGLAPLQTAPGPLAPLPGTMSAHGRGQALPQPGEWMTAQDTRMTAYEGRTAVAEKGIASLQVQTGQMGERVSSLDGRVASLEQKQLPGGAPKPGGGAPPPAPAHADAGPAPAAGSEAAALLFSALDKDGDGVITRDEMLGGFSPTAR